MIGDCVKRLPLAAVAAAMMVLCGASSALAVTLPIKEKLSSQIGWEVAPGSKICTVSKESCQAGLESKEPGGFSFASGAASNNDATSPQSGDVYVTDTGNERVQELSASGQFVAMFGGDVNETTGGNVCTQVEIETKGVKCKAGVEGSASGQFYLPTSVTVDPNTGNLYVQDYVNWRVQELTSTGTFVLMVGKGVNETTGGNVCTQVEVETKSVKCKAGEPSSQGSTEAEAFKFENGGTLLAAGGPEDLVYVGDEQRVQKFDSEGKSHGEISLTSISAEPGSIVTALAVGENGDAYVVYRANGNVSVIHELEPSGKEFGHIELSPRELGVTVGEVHIQGLAIDSSSRLAVAGSESGYKGNQEFRKQFGLLYNSVSGKVMTEFSRANGTGMTFASNDDLYVASSPGEISGGNEVLIYAPVQVAELVALSAPACVLGPDNEADATFNCVLKGEANPEEVLGTQVGFQWGPSLDFDTPKADLAGNASLPLEATIEGLRPNERLLYRVAGNDDNVPSPELLTSETMSFVVPTVPPRIVGEPSASFVNSSSAVMFAELNPESTSTEYLFEYGACAGLASCVTTLKTQTLEAATYGTIGVTQEVTGLQPSTVYHYRLIANNVVAGREGTFTTAPAPVPRAETGVASAIGITSATVSGTVNSDGQPATYAFELGVYSPFGSRYTTVFTGSVGAVTASLPEAFTVTGLQPGTTYSYQIKVTSGYGVSTGAPQTFTTQGQPVVLNSPAPLPMLGIPGIVFPKPLSTKPKPAKPKKKTKHKKASHKKTKRKKATKKHTKAKS